MALTPTWLPTPFFWRSAALLLCFRGLLLSPSVQLLLFSNLAWHIKLYKHTYLWDLIILTYIRGITWNSTLHFTLHLRCITVQNITGKVSTTCELLLPNGCHTTGCTPFPSSNHLSPVIYFMCLHFLQQAAHALRPICACRGKWERGSDLLDSTSFSPVSPLQPWPAWKNRQEHLEYYRHTATSGAQ